MAGRLRLGKVRKGELRGIGEGEDGGDILGLGGFLGGQSLEKFGRV